MVHALLFTSLLHQGLPAFLPMRVEVLAYEDSTRIHLLDLSGLRHCGARRRDPCRALFLGCKGGEGSRGVCIKAFRRAFPLQV